MDTSEVWRSEDTQYCFSNFNGSCPKAPRFLTTRVLLYILFSAGVILTVFGNLVVIISISHFRQLHTPTNFLVVSLAAGDFLLGLSVMPFSMIRTIESCWYFGETYCLLHSTFDMSLTTVSIFHLIFIAIDRHYAICDPLLYSVKITNQVIGVFISVSWLLPITYSYGSVYSKAGLTDHSTPSDSCLGHCVLVFNAVWGPLHTLISFFLPCCVMMGIYAKIFLVARRHARLISGAENAKQITDKGKLSNHKDRKAARTLTIVMTVFVLCWMPAFADAVVDPFFNFPTPTIVYDCLVFLGYCNSALNPIIYAFFYPWFQNALKLIISCAIFRPDSSTINLFSKK
ncbi:trace amine-associated receptor 13c-like [Protopterus annectens]|uniref:trace amine-associated receptor 13c-like n=1 Tax=Protopterus annectens TaxID=7888 RepID=UPI001CFB327D|nr:trace amine-associated receptor 13c-like [Protopterus annectens]